MKKSEGFSGPNDNQQRAGASADNSLHNTDGPLQVTYPDGIYQGDQQKFFKQVVSTNFSVAASKDADGGEAAVVAFHPNVGPLSVSVIRTETDVDNCLARPGSPLEFCHSLLVSNREQSPQHCHSHIATGEKDSPQWLRFGCHSHGSRIWPEKRTNLHRLCG